MSFALPYAHSQALCEEYSDEMASWLALTDKLSKEVLAVVVCTIYECSWYFLCCAALTSDAAFRNHHN